MKQLFRQYTYLDPTFESQPKPRAIMHSSMASRLIYIPLTIALLLVLRHFLRRRSYARRFPPGPKGLFFVGNLLDLPRDDAEKADSYLKWREDYGVYPLVLCDRFLSE